MSRSESCEGTGPRFASPPRGPPLASALSAGASTDLVAERLIVAASVGATVGAAAIVLGVSAPVPFLLGWIALAVALAWELAARARTPRSMIRWDAWGITEEVRGVRTAIPWTSARAWVERARGHVALRVIDEQGRAIACGAGSDLPRWAAHVACRAEDLEHLLPAVSQLPLAGAPAGRAPLLPRALAFACVPLGAVSIALVATGRESTIGAAIPAILVLAVALAPDVGRARALARRGWAMRGARVVALARGSLAVLLDGGRAVPLVVAEPPRDARLAERGQPVRVAMIAEPGADPYRSIAHARAIEALAERRARRIEGAWIAARALLVVAALVPTAALIVPTAPPPAAPAPHRMLGGPRPPAPTAWRSQPGPPRVHREVRPSCPEGRACYPVLTYVDEAGVEVWRCESWSREPCDRRMRDLHPELDLAGP